MLISDPEPLELGLAVDRSPLDLMTPEVGGSGYPATGVTRWSPHLAPAQASSWRAQDRPLTAARRFPGGVRCAAAGRGWCPAVH